uniref:Venom peptide n=1 Tax=Strongyloides papillosus TaxID=174720 RepID=A0A0N5CC09_STREA
MMVSSKKIFILFIVCALSSLIYAIPPSYVDPEELKLMINEWVKNVDNGLPPVRPTRSDLPNSPRKAYSLFHILTPAKFFDSLFTIGNVEMIMPKKPLSKNEEAQKYNKLTSTFGR